MSLEDDYLVEKDPNWLHITSLDVLKTYRENVSLASLPDVMPEPELLLAPMVRISTLPMRLLCLHYGAQLVYSPEIVDKSIIACRREVTPAGVIEYIRNDGTRVFSTLASEKPKLVFQLGTADAALALQAALMVADDVYRIDVNAGCPKKFSIQGGMGAALIYDPDRLCKILEKLVGCCGKPVSCKIRILESLEDTVRLIRRLEATGIVELAIHCRLKDERPRDPAHWHIYRYLQSHIRIPIIANGDFFSKESMVAFMQYSGIRRLLVARGAQSNASIFACFQRDMLSRIEVAQAYFRKAEEVKNSFTNTKYTLMQMWPVLQSDPVGSGILAAKTFSDLSKALYIVPGAENMEKIES